MEDMQQQGEVPPIPLASKKYSGELRVRMPPAIHERLARQAAEEGISLNAIIVRQLA